MHIETLKVAGRSDNYRIHFEDGSHINMDSPVFDLYKKLSGLPNKALIELFQLSADDMKNAIAADHAGRCKKLRRLLKLYPEWKETGEPVDVREEIQQIGIALPMTTITYRLRKRTLDEETLSKLEALLIGGDIIFRDSAERAARQNSAGKT